MNSKERVQFVFSFLLALILFTAIFGFRITSFWVGMGCATLLLATLSVCWEGWPLPKKDFTVTSIGLGILSAFLLYGIFFVGNFVANLLFFFATHQVSSIHMIRHEAHPIMISLVLVFITSPCEEFFWRGWIQKKLMQQFTPITGWWLGAVLYAVVHVASGNFMLVMAAFMAGLFWGFLYWKTKNLWICVISHAVWTVSIFLLFPIGR